MIKLVQSTFFNETETKKKLADFILHADQLSMGEQCRQYEQTFAKKQERKFAVFVANGSLANLVLIQSLLNLGKLQRGDSVGVSALTWSTNVMPIIQLGLQPILIDCEQDTLNISPNQLKPHLGSLKALFITNVLGFCDQLADIRRLCETQNVLLLEDNCEALGSKHAGKLLGNFGLASTFSTFVGHHLSTIEGGMICTDDEELHEMLVMVRAHGWDRNLGAGQQNRLRTKNAVDPFYAKYTFYDLAYNCRPTEIGGFLGNTQMEYWDEIVEKREKNFKQFNEVAKANPDFVQLDVQHMDIVSNFAMPVVCQTKQLFELYKKRFENADVEIRPIIAGSMANQPFFKKYVAIHTTCPNAECIHDQGFYFPNHPELTEIEIESLCQLLRK